MNKRITGSVYVEAKGRKYFLTFIKIAYKDGYENS